MLTRANYAELKTAYFELVDYSGKELLWDHIFYLRTLEAVKGMEGR
jgi:hypothetical protein